MQLVDRQGFATIQALAQHFGVSTQTVRRDIGLLSRAAMLQRFHGGAGSARETVRLGYIEKSASHTAAKAAIGQAVAGEIPDGASVFLDVGTTVEAVARALWARNALRVFTSSLAVASMFAGHASTECYVTGGILRGADGSLVGEATCAAIDQFRAAFAVIGLSGFDNDGALMDFDVQKISVKQRMITNADSVFAVADASKLRRAAIVRFAAPSDIQALFTDAPAPGTLSARFAQAGVRVVVTNQTAQEKPNKPAPLAERCRVATR